MQDAATFGNRRLVGQQHVREQILRILKSGRISHTWLLSGPEGSGKTAFALAFAEALNGVSNLTDLKETGLSGAALSGKSSWFRHPDIHLFIPLPRAISTSPSDASQELKRRLQLLEKDPYAAVDFKRRPLLSDGDASKNRQAFYSIDYIRNVIRPVSRLKPNEARYTVVILTDIELMRREAANSFLKLLEEPPDNVIFLLTATGTDNLLPTITSRCQHLRLQPLGEKEIAGALTEFDDVDPEDAAWLARISEGNYAMTRNMDLEMIRETRKEIIDFLRMAYVQDAGGLLALVQEWQSRLNTENQLALCGAMEMMLRDLMIWRETGREELITNIDQLEVIRKFCESLQQARLADMIDELQRLKGALHQNVQFKLIFTALSFRYTALMRGDDPVTEEIGRWHALPALDPTLP